MAPPRGPAWPEPAGRLRPSSKPSPLKRRAEFHMEIAVRGENRLPAFPGPNARCHCVATQFGFWMHFYVAVNNVG